MTDGKQQLYRVRWVSLLTGAEGYGTGKFTLAEAEALIDEFNKKRVGNFIPLYYKPIEEGENDG